MIWDLFDNSVVAHKTGIEQKVNLVAKQFHLLRKKMDREVATLYR